MPFSMPSPGGQVDLKRINSKMNAQRGGIAKRVCIPVLVATLLLLAYGSLVIWTASASIEEASFPRHLFGIALGTVLALLIYRADLRNLSGLATVLLVIDLIVIFSPYIPGLSHNAKGMTGWIKVPLIGLTFQPVEMAKLITIFFMASLGAQYNGVISSLRDYAKLCAMLAVPFGAVVVAGDLGSGLVVFFAGAMVILMSGPKKEWVLVTLAIIVGGVALLLTVNTAVHSITGEYPILKQYQMNRLFVFLNPDENSEAGYNLMQSLIAVGSGGFFGKGIGNASQALSGFLPEAHTDFVFALLSEEFGFVGAVLLVIFYALLLFSIIRVAHRSESPFLRLVGVGIVGMWTFQIFENIGMCIGLMPITGIPLPFISFGSSSMLMSLATIGIVQSIWRTGARSASSL